MKKKYYRYYPWTEMRFVLLLMEIFQDVMLIFVGVALLDFLHGEFLWPMVFLLCFCMLIFLIRLYTFRLLNMQVCFTDEGLYITAKPWKEEFFPWDSFHYGYTIHTYRVSFWMLSWNPLTQSQLIHLRRKTLFPHMLKSNSVLILPIPPFSEQAELFPAHIQFLGEQK